ncbi:hypothetical protein RHMOL_Rhmol09G0171400 [Rhododendron molle]|uniref:Uncharacterized protein n=1 Tax=Rhododendron molle TaxID=49168 RepID=A0ACC0MEA8_RHOML|nr:hypothetical protein RHMOL_Rhmol09G0171400 [Rhododendron molle]
MERWGGLQKKALLEADVLATGVWALHSLFPRIPAVFDICRLFSRILAVCFELFGCSGSVGARKTGSYCRGKGYIWSYQIKTSQRYAYEQIYHASSLCLDEYAKARSVGPSDKKEEIRGKESLCTEIGLDRSKVEIAEARAPESCSVAADCGHLCGTSGDCVNGVCTCGGGSQEELDVVEAAMSELSCFDNRYCQTRCSPVCYSKFCVEGKCQSWAIKARITLLGAKTIFDYALEIDAGFTTPRLHDLNINQSSNWSTPRAGTIKLNTDGCWYESNGKARFGGLFRDAKGDWILRFFGKINCGSSIEAGLWGIYKGLQIILEKSLQNVQIELDAMLAVNLINDENPGSHAQSVIIHKALGLLVRTDTTLNHVYRTANQCADHLAHMGIEQDKDLIVAVDILISLREFLIKDGLNI